MQKYGEFATAPTIEQRQQALVAHRLNFWGTPTSGNTVSWDYQGQPWLVKRPDDGDLPLERIVRCKECKKTLTYSVLSVEAALARQRRWRVCAYSGLALLVAGVLGLIFLHGAGTAWLVISLVAAAVGFVSGWCFGLTATEETGITGHFNSWPGATKHSVRFDESRPGNAPELICAHCGHQEQFRHGSHLRKEFVRKEYEAAKVRFDDHQCGRPSPTP